jgi:hypothetical protein
LCEVQPFYRKFVWDGNVNSTSDEKFITVNEDILKYIQQDETSHSLFHLKTALHISGVNTTHHQERKKTVSTASGICHTVTVTCRYRGEFKQ